VRKKHVQCRPKELKEYLHLPQNSSVPAKAIALLARRKYCSIQDNIQYNIWQDKTDSSFGCVI
jgi:hypothetical protein